MAGMAYNRAFNPDALPAFAEPERKPQHPSSSVVNPPRTSSSAPQGGYHQKPPPPLPAQGPRVDSHGRPPPTQPHGGPAPPSAYRQSPAPLQGNYRQPTPVGQQQGNVSQAQSSAHGGQRYASAGPPAGSGAPAANRAPATSRPPTSPIPTTRPADSTLLPLFRAVDKDGSGQLSERELGAALVNGDWSAFDSYTVRLMIRMFDSDGSGTIGFEEFCGLWSFLASWRTLFDRFDVDCSGNISIEEFTHALAAFGYRLGDGFVRFLFGVYDREKSGALSFDMFVQACIGLKRMTDVFKRYDDDRDGFITLSFEDFLTEILRQR